MSIKPRTILIGIDGLGYTMIQKLFTEGVMPNFQKIANNGVLSHMMASIPDNSAVSWSSIMTGKNPGEHGVFGFTGLIPGTYTLNYPNFLNLQSKPFWHIKQNKKYIIINLPFTYPAQPLNGLLISGFITPDINKAVYPIDFLEYLTDIKYSIDVDAGKAYKSKELFLNNIFDVLEKRVELYQYLWTHNEWDTFMVVFTGSDRLEHFLLDVFEYKIAPYYDRFLEYFKRIDDTIGWINDRMVGSDNLIMMSDHGMELIKTEVYINNYLIEGGFLSIDEAEKQNYNHLSKDTKAFALEPARIHLNLKGKYPNGNVEENEIGHMVSNLKKHFNNLRYNGKKVIKEMHLKEEIYSGAQLDVAPELLLVSNPGYSLRGSIGKDQLFSNESILTGMHRRDDAFLFVNAAESKNIVSENPHVEDIVEILNKIEG